MPANRPGEALPQRRSCVEINGLHRSLWSRRPLDFHAIAPLKGRIMEKWSLADSLLGVLGGALPHIFTSLLPDKARNGGRRSRSAAKSQSDRWSLDVSRPHCVFAVHCRVPEITQAQLLLVLPVALASASRSHVRERSRSAASAASS